ncbi:DNA-directed RNA polymerase subunit beta' [Conexibacter sp. JD483]|uniref:DNA-directed RNA polymerase subunit beta' n=1 Tax=unclassified Conexibacter TaxID=2627773 RepID=UPI00271C89C3|nr:MULTISPECIES: DNA-directed RNA polymerase subunit beta' [unclassified Conexibacter]MDO8186413.1 DNA-directed RNA polymerase subunit beta' [Conexibacter sp. CPCC 205706]MDO8199812.1 DNA-directed RNA polymerase subunit beta' [Conexibacter sp. CPCC 205762]MDR9369168.1 DNA-directed RNA polymerase subunit beta' [Conexibacter sp. JD483]
MIDINNFDAIEIGLASSKQIRSWSSGEVTKPETINYRTLKPEKDGLFCERIFGPTKDWECYCGKYKRVRYKGIVCERCGVEVTRSKVRRERMGHIDLAAPVSHIWFFKGVPSRIGYLLDMAPKELEKVLYFAASIVTWIDDEARERDLDSLQDQVNTVLDSYAAEKEERLLELRESLERRVEFLESGRQSNQFNDEDEMWAESLDINVARLSDEEREKLLRDLRRTFTADMDDTEAYIEDAAERMRQVWDLFQSMKPKDVVNDETLFRELKDRFGSPFGFGEYFRGGMGAESVRDLLEQVDLEDERAELQELVKTAKGQKQSRSVKRLKVVSAFIQSGNRPEMMILEAVPVIPPELRPMVQLDGGRFATSDLNDLYRRVINRNNRLKRLLDLGAPEIIVNNEKRMLQEAVDALFDNGRRGRPVTGPGNRPLKSLSDMLKGKQGRFRQNLLGKRVDYSGRSVIVSGPSLRLHQCGLPKLMALELFKPFIMARLVERKAAQNIKAAKKMVDSMIPEVWDVLEEVIHEHPVLLNRAPTLHRLGIQAFEPQLVEGKAIQVHPLVCSAFNADFDGDQMAVHLPLSAEAQAEARILMLSANNILSPAHGAPLATPTQDMILGAYYLTYGPEVDELSKIDPARHQPRPHVYRTAQEAEWSYEHGVTRLHDVAEYRPAGRDGGHILTTVGRIIYNDKIERAIRATLGEDYDPSSYEFVNRSMKKRDTTQFVDDLVQAYGAATISQVLDAFKDLGFRYATQAGITVSKNDVVIPPDKPEILAKYEGHVAEIQDQYDMGLITEEERKDAVVEQWTAATEEVADAMEQHFNELNPIFMMANSGARGSFKQIRQLAGMRGLMANPKGEIIERPVKANFMEGLDVIEYFTSTHGARKGLADTALRTADSGYLTRRLVDVAQDVIIREEDCGTEEYVELNLYKDGGEPNDNLVGRVAAKDLGPKRGVVAVARGIEMSRADFAALLEAYGEDNVKIPVRSVLKCEALTGVCQACYGRSMATGNTAQIGDAVGIVAAQSIGEPGTQLTMRTFHTGGVAGADITHGLPRVVELFEARKPKGLAKIAEVGGVVDIEETDKALTVVITDDGGDEHRHTFPRRTRLFVEKGEKVDPGRQLNEGSLYPHELLAIRGRTETELYLVKEVQEVYKSQGVDINDKHIELIVRQMLKKVRVDQKGDTDLLPGVFVDRHDYARINQAVMDAGGEPAQAEEIILGITKASLNTDSFLSAASFQETTKVLTDAALEGKIDRLNGLKENVIIGKLIPAATGLKRYRRIEIEPAEPLPRGMDDVGLLDHDELAAELGLTDGEALQGFGPSGIEADLADLEEIGNGGGSHGFAEELAELDVPEDRS